MQKDIRPYEIRCLDEICGHVCVIHIARKDITIFRMLNTECEMCKKKNVMYIELDPVVDLMQPYYHCS